MAESQTRLVKSGKTYRQLFDAEVQLMNALDVSRKKQVLPDIGSSNTMPKYERSQTGLTAQSILTNRQANWKDGVLNDFRTENPVVNKQRETEVEIRKAKKVKEKVGSEVRGLPTQVILEEDLRIEPESIISRIQNSCQQRYDKHLCNMYDEISDVKNLINPKVAQVSTALNTLILNTNTEIQRTFEKLRNQKFLVLLEQESSSKNLDDFEPVWVEIEKLFAVKSDTIKKFHVKFNNLEDERLHLITEVLAKYAHILKDISAIPVSETRRLMEKESMLLNQSSLANRRAYGELQRNLLERVIQEELSGRRRFEHRIANWKILKRDHIKTSFINYMQTRAVRNPDRVRKLNDQFMEEQQKLIATRTSILDQLNAFQPPVSTKPSVYKWNSSLTKAQRNIEELHRKWLESLQMEYEKCCQLCLEKVDQAKEELELVTDDSLKIVNEEFLTRVGNQLKVFEHQLHCMERELEERSRANETELRGLFKFAQSVAHLWDVHEINVARKDKEVEVELDRGRLMYDKTNEEREARLDVLLDRLRQENSPDNLDACQQLCFHLLEEIKNSYHEFFADQANKMELLPELVKEELERYEKAVCDFFNISKTLPASSSETNSRVSPPPKEDEGEERVESEEEEEEVMVLADEMKRKIGELLTTPAGHTYYLTGDDVTCMNDDVSDDDDMTSDDDDEGSEVNAEKLLPRGSSEPSPEYVKGVLIEHDRVCDLKRKIRESFLHHLDELAARSLEKCDEKVSYKKDELSCELELRLHLHAPRCDRIRKDIRNVREVELSSHEDRIERHCKGITSTLATFKSTQAQFVEFEADRIADFKQHIATVEEGVAKSTQCVMIERMVKDTEERSEETIETLKREAKEVRKSIVKKLTALKKSNKACLASFKLFADGGSFSPDEAYELRKRIEEQTRKVELYESTLKNEFETNVEKKCEGVRELYHRFAERTKSHTSDQRFVEQTDRWFRYAHVNIKAELTMSERTWGELSADVQLLVDRIDAFEYEHVDKEKVDADVLWQFTVETIDKIADRCRYLDCRVKPPSRRSSMGSQEEEMDEMNTTQTEGEVEAPKNIVSVIKSILKKQSSGVTRGEETALANVQKRTKIYCETSERRKSQDNDSRKTQVQTSLGYRRDSKMDSRFFPFGFEAPRKKHFLARVSRILYEVLENLYAIADHYYKHRGFRTNTRPHLIQENFESCSEAILEKTLVIYDKCQSHYDHSLSEFRFMLERCEILLQNVPRILIAETEEKLTEEFNAQLRSIEDNFEKVQAGYEQEKRKNESELDPCLGHPQLKDKLENLVKKEEKRKANQERLISETYDKTSKLIEDWSVQFIEALNTSSKKFLKNFQNLLCIDDVITPDTAPEIKMSMEWLVRRRVKHAIDMDKLNKRDRDINISNFERGCRTWPALKIPQQILDSNTDLKMGWLSEMETLNAVKPQQATLDSRDSAFNKLIMSREEAMKARALKRDDRELVERRWKEHWDKSVNKIINFYT